MTDLSLENILGAKDNVDSLELALNAELILKMSVKSDGYCPDQLVRATVLLVGNAEKLDPALREKFKAFKEER